MSKYFYTDSAIHHDHHKEWTLNISGKTDVVALIREMMRDDVEDIVEVVEEPHITNLEKSVIQKQAKVQNHDILECEKTSFYNIIQHPNPETFLSRLHQLIDGRKGADVGCVLLKSVQDGYLSRRPTQNEFISEFTLIGSWTAIHNYMNDNSEKALDRANKVIIF